MKLWPNLIALLLVIHAIQPGVIADGAPRPLVNAHAHNDYEHTRPLFDALDHGFCSIEADIYLVDGQLLVAHDRADVKPERTLQALYLDPLRQRISMNGGRLFKDGPPAILLIDVKSDADATYAVLRNVLLQYTNIFTRFTPTAVETNALTAIISGNRARAMLEAEPVRFAALDGRPEDLNGNSSSSLIPLVSEDWKRLFKWKGTGRLTEGEKTRLFALIEKAHAQGRKIRFWGTPDTIPMWEELNRAQVDLINADDLTGLESFLDGQAVSGAKSLRAN